MQASIRFVCRSGEAGLDDNRTSFPWTDRIDGHVADGAADRAFGWVVWDSSERTNANAGEAPSEAPSETPPEAPPEAPPDAPPDAPPEAPPDAAPKAPPKVAPNAAPKAAPEAPLESNTTNKLISAVYAEGRPVDCEAACSLGANAHIVTMAGIIIAGMTRQ
jgi:hypothetical protein